MPDIWGLGRPVPSSDPDTSAAEVVTVVREAEAYVSYYNQHWHLTVVFYLPLV